jgi:hypothetical protein
MKRTVVFSLVAVLLLLTALAGCASARPSPASITLSDGGSELQIKPGDAAYASVVAQLDRLIAGLDTPLYAYYPPERVADEILVRPHLEAVYSPSVILKGKGYEAEVGQLIVVVTGEGPLVLTQAREGADWTASESSDAGRFTSLFQVIRDRTGIDLQAAAR